MARPRFALYILGGLVTASYGVGNRRALFPTHNAGNQYIMREEERGFSPLVGTCEVVVRAINYNH